MKKILACVLILTSIVTNAQTWNHQFKTDVVKIENSTIEVDFDLDSLVDISLLYVNGDTFAVNIADKTIYLQMESNIQQLSETVFWKSFKGVEGSGYIRIYFYYEDKSLFKVRMLTEDMKYLTLYKNILRA